MLNVPFGKATLVSAIGMALMLTACGGGGGGSDPVAPVDPVMASIKSVPAVKEQSFVSPDPVICPKTSHPLNTMLCSVGLNLDQSGAAPIDLKKDWGYVEKEFFLSGKANVYDLDKNERAVVRSAGNSYVNRLLVRFPDESKVKFSGRVYIEILNASNNYDVENTWRRAWKYMMQKGDAYIGITSKSVCATALKKFDAERYKDINWQVNGKDENGLFWDMLSQLATLLRQPGAGGVLGKLQPQYLYLTGESQSGMYMNTYLTAFSDKIEKGGPDGKPLFDGYLNGVGPMHTFLRSESAEPFVSIPTKLYLPTTVPHIVYMSENESTMYNGMKNGVPGVFPPALPYRHRADSNTAADKFRFYEYAGTPHSDPISPILPINAEITKAGGNPRNLSPTYPLPTQEHNDLQLTEFVHAMHESIHEWAKNGVPAPAGENSWILYNTTLDTKGNKEYAAMRDWLGNVYGGIRSPMIEVPLHKFRDAGKNDNVMERFPDAQINALYNNSCPVYLARFNASADALLASRYVTESGASYLKAWAKTQAGKVTWAGTACN